MATADEYAQWIVANKDKKGTPEFETVAEAYRLAKQEAPSGLESWKRGLGLGTRSLIEGMLTIPKLGANALTGVTNIGLASADVLSGKRVPYRVPYQSDNVSDLIGLPSPQTEAEQRTDSAGRMVYGTLGGLGIGRMLGMVPGSVPPPGSAPAGAVERTRQMIPEAGRILGRNPIQQTTAAVVGPLAGEGARQLGAPPIVQGAVEIGSQMLVPGDDAIMSMADRVKRGGARAAAQGTPLGSAGGGAKRRTSGVFEPFTPEGRERAVGRVLYESANDPAAAAGRMGNAPRLIPGSVPTAGQASGDVGLLSLENSLGTPIFDPRNDLGLRRLDQNAAQRSALDRIGGWLGLDQKIAERRNRWAAAKVPQIFDEARQAGGGMSSLDGVDQAISSTLSKSIGKREPVQEALDYVRTRIDSIRSDGSSMVQSDDLYAIRQDIAQLLEGKLQGGKARDGSIVSADKFRAARGQVVEVLDQLDQAIEAGTPGFKAYMQRYSRMSRAAEGAEVLGTIASRARSASATDPRTADPLLQTAGLARAAASLSSEAGRALPPFQQQMLSRIEEDMRRGAAGQSAAIRGAGSDTFQKIGGNITVANIIGRALGQGVGRDQKLDPVLAPFRWLLETPEAETKALLIRAVLDPDLAAKLLKGASDEALKEAADALKAKAAYGGVAGQVITQGGLLSQKPSPPEGTP